MGHNNKNRLLAILIQTLSVSSAFAASSHDDCLIEKLQQASDSTTVAELREQCALNNSENTEPAPDNIQRLTIYCLSE